MSTTFAGIENFDPENEEENVELDAPKLKL